MGYVDSDAHVQECRDTWNYFDPGESSYGPGSSDVWMVEGTAVRPEPGPPRGLYPIYPEGALTLRDVGARVAQLDDLGIDVQVCYSSFWLMQVIENPTREAAMARSWNRWMAERAAESSGRLRWTCHVPLRDHRRAAEELLFAKEHGAAGVLTLGLRYGLPLTDPSFWPVWDQVQDLDMVIGVHVGGSMREYLTNPIGYYYTHELPIVGAYHAIINSNIIKRFPRLRFAFLENGGGWVPAAQTQRFRATDNSATRYWGDWRARAAEALEGSNLYVSCFLDEDLDYLMPYIGEDRMLLGTDYGHLDAGSEPDALSAVQSRSELTPTARRKMTDDNARTCFGVDPNFRPTDGTASPADAKIIRHLHAMISEGITGDLSGSAFEPAISGQPA